MTASRVRVGDVLRLERFPIVPDPSVEYVAIGVRSFGKGIFHYEPTLGSELGSLRFYAIEPGCLVVSNIKGWEGAVAMAATSESGCIASNRFLTYVPIDGRIDIRWARWYFLSEGGIEQLQRASPGSADRNRTLAIERFENLEIPLPSIEEQRRVAEKLDHVNAAVNRAQLLRSRARMLGSALGSSLADRPDLSEEHKSHTGWRRIQLGELLTLALDVVPVEPMSDYEIAGVLSFGRGLFRRSSIPGTATSYSHFHRIRGGQLVMSRLKAWEGALAVAPPSFSGTYVSPEFPTFDIRSEVVHPDVLGSILNSPGFWSQLKGESKGIGARRERVNADRLLEAVVVLPSQADQEHLAAILPFQKAIAGRTDNADRLISALVKSTLRIAFPGPVIS